MCNNHKHRNIIGVDYCDDTLDCKGMGCYQAMTEFMHEMDRHDGAADCRVRMDYTDHWVRPEVEFYCAQNNHEIMLHGDLPPEGYPEILVVVVKKN